MAPTAPDPADLVRQRAARIARRNLPPTPAPDAFTPARTVERLAAHLAELLPTRNRRGLLTHGRLCCAFLTHETRTAAQLAAAGGVGRAAGRYAHGSLVRAGLLSYTWLDRQRQYGLTRFGEDWLLAVARNETPPTAAQ
jgi:hypothetical protein